ncbi:NAD(+)/NADH kinase [Leucobacter sp. CSA2]|uniref:NAD(+)/NADH kinase n=1 Tax=Leucobacter edaphi TaxID=2796472 RepID=A0A934UWQ4_9MICO|nr:NAD(+)/NADH kinase [Leucobacter edaphi]MBK0421924.1 NAD(+)/NADH kinase [Leucobacter edaphi]
MRAEANASPPAIGLVVNPLAGIGGEVGLGGSDGARVQEEASRLGGRPRSPERAARFVRELERLVPGARVLTGPGALGEDVAPGAEIVPVPEGIGADGATTAAATASLARSLAERGAALIVFVGGDGTARDVMRGIGRGSIGAGGPGAAAGPGADAGQGAAATQDAVGPGDAATARGAEQLCLGVPAGVKMHSGVFAVTPEDAAAQAAEVLAGRGRSVERDVVDLDEDARRAGVLSTAIFGTMRVPLHERMQRGKRSPAHGSGIDAAGVAAELRESAAGLTLVFGPGTTTARVAERFGIEPTLLGFDAISPDGTIRHGLTGEELERIAEAGDFAVVLSPVGGQGFVIGRGNHQLTARVLERLERERLILVAEPAKLGELAGRLRIDAPTAELNAKFRGTARVLLGQGEIAVGRIE